MKRKLFHCQLGRVGEMNGFDEWFIKFGMERNHFSSDDEKHWFKHNVKAGYKEGRQSRQKEIDALKEKINCYEKLTLSLRNEFDLWTGSNELEQHINAQIEILESLKEGVK